MKKKHFQTELLAPGGSFEKAMTAFNYGADAVYIGGHKYSLRSRAMNFTLPEIGQLCQYAAPLGKKVYVVINSFFHDEDFSGLESFVKQLEAFGVDAFIISDLGVIDYLKDKTQVDIHLSTQASCLNSYAGKFWKEQGVKRLILGREASLSQASAIKKSCGLEIELFVHGSLCMAYSGHCVISNYTSGRDSNRGGCAHSCRYEYGLNIAGNKVEKTFMSSKDLAGLELVPKFHEFEIDSMKVEGRMKSTHYAGTISKVYAEAIAVYQQRPDDFSKLLPIWQGELAKLANRDYTQGNLAAQAGESSVFNEREYVASSGYESVGFVKAVSSELGLVVEVRKKFGHTDELECLPLSGENIRFSASKLTTLEFAPLEFAKPSSFVRLPYLPNISTHCLIRRRV